MLPSSALSLIHSFARHSLALFLPPLLSHLSLPSKPPLAWIRMKSRVSLVTSVLSSICLFVGFGLSWTYPVIAFAIGAIIAANLAINFALRVQATRKFFPPGLLLIISLGVFVFLCILAARAPPTKGLPDSNAAEGRDTRAMTSAGATAAAASSSSGRRGLMRRRPPIVPLPPPGVPRRPPAVRETP